MDEGTGVRKKLGRSLGQDLPDSVWEAAHIQGLAGEYLEAPTDKDRNDAWGALEEGARERLDIWNDGGDKREEKLSKSARSVAISGSQDMREAEERDSSGGRGGLDVREFGGERTRAMTGAMSALFALIGDQFPEVKEFRERVLPGRFLTADEAHALIASYAARVFCLSRFEEWGIPFVGHRAEIVDTGPRGEHYNPVDDWMTVRVDPPGITKTVRYAYPPSEGDPNTRCMVQSGAVVPIHTYFPIESHGNHTYPSWLWPGSVVDKLYDISVELAGAFDWPRGSIEGNLTGMRPTSASAAWFVLTGEAPQVRPIAARWEQVHGSTHLNPQWRIQVTVPAWLPEEEVLQVFRTLRRQRPEGRYLPKTAKPLDVARFVWERERLDGYRERAPWTAWLKRWNAEHPGHRIETPSNFRTYFFRGDAAVKHLNFDWPNFESPGRRSDTA